MNVMRIAIIAVVYANWGLDWSSGTSHEILGLSIFTIVFLALIGTDQLLLGLLAPIAAHDETASTGPIKYGSRIVAFWDWLQALGSPREGAVPTKHATQRLVPSGFAFSIVPLLAFGVLASLQFSISTWFHAPIAQTQSLARACGLHASVLPKSIDTLSVAGFTSEDRTQGDVFGDYSRMFEYRDKDGNAFLVSCDFPFGPLWHDLRTCYRGQGWHVAEYEVKETEGHQAGWGYIEAMLTKPDGTAAYLTYCVFDEHGSVVSPPRFTRMDQLWQSFLQQFGRHRSDRLFQVQVWTTAFGEIDESKREAALRLLLEVREPLRRFVTEGDPTDQNAATELVGQ
jgi:hypothetical protein